MVEPQFDVFLAHRSSDKPLIRQIYGHLKNRGLKPWLDEEELVPGTRFQAGLQQAIRNVKTAAICIGQGDLGSWQDVELNAVISQAVKRSIPVIPILLPGVESIPESLPFLENYHGIFFRDGMGDERALFDLEWGITGIKPSRPRPPVVTPPVTQSKLEWAGDWFVNVGEGNGHRSWEDCRRYGFMSAGQGPQFAAAMRKLEVSSIVYAYVSGSGYVGFGKVLEKAVPIKAFMVGLENTPLLEMDLKAGGLDINSDDPEFSEWVARIEWLEAVPREQAYWFTGAFAHVGTLCKLRDQKTLDALHKKFIAKGSSDDNTAIMNS
jgi:TIR domain